MSEVKLLGVPWEAPASPPLCGIAMDLLPLDLVTQWRRCGMISDCFADYLSYAFERRDVARSILSTVVNELVENAVKFSADKLEPARVALEHHGAVLLVEARNVAEAVHVERLAAELGELSREDASVVFARRLGDRGGLGLALVANDYRAALGATVTPRGAGLSVVCVRAALPAREVEQR